MRKMSNKGFTLIELLAVITIMGILMMVAIPAVSRTIENSRRDTFNDVAKTYINAVRNAVLADEIECLNGSKWQTVAATPNGVKYAYYFGIDTNEIGTSTGDTKEIRANTEAILESGGTSSWGNADVVGYVKWTKLEQAINGGTGDKTVKTNYYVSLVDTGNHGIDGEVKETLMSRNKVLTSGATQTGVPTVGKDAGVDVTDQDTLMRCRLK